MQDGKGENVSSGLAASDLFRDQVGDGPSSISEQLRVVHRATSA